MNEEKKKWEVSYPGPKRLEIMPFNMHYKANSRYYVQVRNGANKAGGALSGGKPKGDGDDAPEMFILLRFLQIQKI